MQHTHVIMECVWNGGYLVSIIIICHWGDILFLKMCPWWSVFTLYELHARWSYRRWFGSLLLCACWMCDVSCSSAISISITSSHCFVDPAVHECDCILTVNRSSSTPSLGTNTSPTKSLSPLSRSTEESQKPYTRPHQKQSLLSMPGGKHTPTPCISLDTKVHSFTLGLSALDCWKQWKGKTLNPLPCALWPQKMNNCFDRLYANNFFFLKPQTNKLD